MKLYPLKFRPIYKEKVWGGGKLRDIYGRQLPANIRIGESWEIADRSGDVSCVANGELEGISMRDLIRKDPERVLGRAFGAGFAVRFPLLIKFIDAKEPLSVQVHPDDAYAAAHEGGEAGKTELWYVLQSDRDAELMCGFQGESDRDSLVAALKGDNPLEKLRRIRVKSGDAVFVTPGSIHTIGAGVLILEVGTNSDVTYRLYDCGRTGRQLHVKPALDVINFEDREDHLVGRVWHEGEGYRSSVIVDCPYFRTREIVISEHWSGDCAGERFCVISVVSGEGRIVYGDQPDTIAVGAGDNLLLPAAMGEYKIVAGRAGCGVLHTEVP
ncbi:MAG: mannose-6-phosphate isomerase [Candidatus Aureabacteria bacterium]|nr:mannose-6-phosphate isomerase [Candidatus Auribacterota bacterium]